MRCNSSPAENVEFNLLHMHGLISGSTPRASRYCNTMNVSGMTYRKEYVRVYGKWPKSTRWRFERRTDMEGSDGDIGIDRVPQPP